MVRPAGLFFCGYVRNRIPFEEGQEEEKVENIQLTTIEKRKEKEKGFS